MDSKKFEILMTAVNLGSFSKASEVVGYTQSGLTHLINGLEREIGMKLIRRDHSGISLTEDGEALLPAIREYLSATAKLENQIETITQSGRRRSESPLMRALPCTGCRKFCTASAACVRRPTWIFAWWTTSSNPLSCSRRGARTSSLPRGRAINCDWTPLYYDAMYAILPEDYPTGSEETFPIEESDGKEF